MISVGEPPHVTIGWIPSSNVTIFCGSDFLDGLGPGVPVFWGKSTCLKVEMHSPKKDVVGN